MARTQRLPIGELVRDFTLYPRAYVDPVTVRRLEDAINSGATLPPIQADLATKRVVDGFHRIAAHERLGIQTIPTLLEEYATDADLYMAAVEANSHHGRPLTPTDVQRITITAEKLGVEYERIAGAVGIPSDQLRKRVITATVRNNGTDRFALKKTYAHLVGTEVTKEQEHANRISMGMSQASIIGELIRILETDSLEPSRTVQKQMERLRELMLDMAVA